MESLKAHKLVTATMVVRPDADVAWDALVSESIQAVHLKSHYVWDPALPRPEPRRKTRRNLGIARRHWRIESVSPERIATTGAELHAELASRRNLSAIANVLPSHFQILARLPGVEALGAIDDEGLGAMLIAARSPSETHLLHLLTTPRVIRTCGSYLLMAEALERWGRDRRLYLGGSPNSVDGPGIAQFKARWSNRTASVTLVAITVDHAACRDLAGSRPSGGFFPPYRAAR